LKTISRRQPYNIHGTGKKPGTYSYMPDELKDCVRRDSIRWKCSESWIVATALAAFYDVDLATPFEKVNYNKKKNEVKVEPLKFKKRA